MAIKVHRLLGLGLLESAYEQCLVWELENSGLSYARQVPLPLTYEGNQLACAYRADIIVDQQTILEIKSVEGILAVHEAQALTYLRLSGCKSALLMNFNSVRLKDGLCRFVR